MKNTLEEPRNPGRVLILADMHLKPLDCPGLRAARQAAADNERLAGFLETVGRDAGMLVLLGDAFSFWFERHSRVVGDYLATLSLFKAASEKGLAIHHVSGNHDFVVGDGLGFDAGTRYPGFFRLRRGFTVSRLVDFGIEPHGPRFCFHHQGRMVACVHGDSLCGKQRLHMLLRWIMQGPLGRMVMRWMPWPVVKTIVPFAQGGMKKTRADRDPERIFAEASLKREIALGSDLLLCGHIHEAHTRDIEVAGRTGRMEVIPAWLDGHYGVLENGETRVETFP